METLGILFPIIAWIASVFTFIYCMILVFKTFTGKHQPTKLEKSAHEPPIGMLIPPMILAALVILIFFFPNVLAKYIIQPAFIADPASLCCKWRDRLNNQCLAWLYTRIIYDYRSYCHWRSNVSIH